MTAELATLRARIDAATGPDRELDLSLAEALVPDVVVLLHNRGTGQNERSTYWHYTASIDAALALVERLLPGWLWTFGSYGPDDGPWACITEPTEPCADYAARGPTPALAILSALMSAMIERESDAR